MSINFIPNNQVTPSFGQLSDREARQLAKQKTDQEMKPERFARNSKLLVGLAFLPFLVNDQIFYPGSKGFLKFGSFILTLLGFNALNSAARNNINSYREFDKNNPVSSFILRFAALIGLTNVVSRGLEAGGVYDKAAEKIDAKFEKFTQNRPKLNNFVNKIRNGLAKIATPTTVKILNWSPLLLIPAMIFRAEHYKNKYKENFSQNYAEIKFMDS